MERKELEKLFPSIFALRTKQTNISNRLHISGTEYARKRSEEAYAVLERL